MNRYQKLVNRYQKFAVLVLLTGFVWAMPRAVFAVTAEDLDQRVKGRDTAFYREFFDRIFYDQFAHFLRFDRLADDVTFRKREALDVNWFDEVPDSGFFTNRHGRKSLSAEELKRGPAKSDGPDPRGSWRVTKGKLEGVSTGLFVEDQKGDRYLLKFDPKENPEMMTSAEIISHKFFYAFGYHVAEYFLVSFDPSILTLDPKATYYNEDGFKKPLDQAALEELIGKIPKMKGGLIRASASKILANAKGYMSFEGRRTSDPDDLIPHEDRRSLRSLRVFGSWLNHYDLREGNTLDVVEDENGKAQVKHYLIDFGSTLGSAADHPKVPAAGYEHVVDWVEVGKAAPTLKLIEKRWEKKWDALNRQIAYPELGYFDNSQFDPGAWKTQLPYEVFDRLTASDAFWAAKIMMALTDEEIRAVVETGQFSASENAKILSDILIARRDLVGRYWFSQVTPLDGIRLFDLGGGSYEVRFDDLSVRYGFAQSVESQYRFRIESGSPQEFQGSSFKFDVSVLKAGNRVVLYVQVKRGGDGEWSEPALKIVLEKNAQDSSFVIAEIDRGT